ncbi:hypothetical protein MF271_08185 [Deinococcus sp. KNUC1210]|uniref:hypothetical protein n=1 Tax=Deinococcus sp. KNUC1210 TaxID=2917691 RepID=UPI001EF08B15|nr:hypothetical protein [Deinococcus sp. KNUC1210]ULH16539.1 hypothetical protein MF271_08185 [Deinococcus sp. KNUC1210]
MLNRCRLLVALGLGVLTPLAQAQTAPAAPAPAATSSVPSAAASLSSALGVEVSGFIKGRLVPCPKGLKLASSAVCLYTVNTLPSLRSLLRGKLAGRTVGDWKTTAGDKSASLLLKVNNQNAFVLLAQLSATESLVVLDAVSAKPAAGTAAPAGVVKGQAYVLDSDLKGLVNVVALGGGTFRLSSVGGQSITVASGKKAASMQSGSVELPAAPVFDGKNLLFPLEGLRSMACTVTPAESGATVACGSASASIRPIIF